MILAEKIYYHSPVFLQNVLLSAYGIKLYLQRYKGGIFSDYLASINRNTYLGKKEIEKLQLDRLRHIIKYACENVSYYHKEYNRLGISADMIKSLIDIKKLPIIDKNKIQEYPEMFISKRFKGKTLLTVNTSGTSGKPLKIFCNKNALQRNYAHFTRFKESVGISLKDRSITFAGRAIIPPEKNAPPFWRYNLIMNNMIFSSYHLSETNLPFYTNMLNKFRPKFIDSYPSAISLIAEYALENQIEMHRPRAIITSAETLLERQRDATEKAFGCKVYDQYGSAEMAASICQCKDGNYHISPDYGIIEFLRDGDKEDVIDSFGEMICTGFVNCVMPLIRYRIGDQAILTSGKCSCGCNFPVVKSIMGRIDDLIVTKDGRMIGRLDPIFKGLKGIYECQIVQKSNFDIILRIVKGPKFEEKESQYLIYELRKRVGSSIGVCIEYVESIPRTQGGKFKAVVSYVSKKSQPAM